MEARRAQRARRLIQLAYGIAPIEPTIIRYDLIGDDIAVLRMVTEHGSGWTVSVRVARAVGRRAEPLLEDSRDNIGGLETIKYLEALYAKYSRGSGAEQAAQ